VVAIFSNLPQTLCFSSGATPTFSRKNGGRIPVDERILNLAPQPFQYNVIRKDKLLLDRGPNRQEAFEGNGAVSGSE
jgi:hypothetical protein